MQQNGASHSEFYQRGEHIDELQNDRSRPRSPCVAAQRNAVAAPLAFQGPSPSTETMNSHSEDNTGAADAKGEALMYAGGGFDQRIVHQSKGPSCSSLGNCDMCVVLKGSCILCVQVEAGEIYAARRRCVLRESSDAKLRSDFANTFGTCTMTAVATLRRQPGVWKIRESSGHFHEVLV